jgi:CheY-like chemotaxis protein
LILVVEEDETFAGILLAECRRRGLEVLSATDAETALGLLRDHPVAGILLDRMLPGMSGYEFLRRVKGDPSYCTIPVFIISALDDDGRGWLEGAVGYLTKPLDPDGIRAALARLAHFQAGRTRTLLVVEDEQPVRETITNQLQAEDVSVTAVPTATAAYRALAGAEFDAMVLDLRLPDAQGIELLERLGAERKINPPPVILYTAADLSAQQQQALRHYTHHVIRKNAHSLERLHEAVGLFLHRVQPPRAEVLGRSAGDTSGAPGVDWSGRQVLIVDDDMRSTYALGKVLRDWGMEVHLAADGAKGLEILAREPGIDLVLIDVMMPEMDGNEATRRIRAQARFAELPIITLSAKAMEEDREASLAAGANAFVPKPIDTDALAAALGEWLHPVAAT